MNSLLSRRPVRARGFSLIELVVAMLIAALLAVFALSTYTTQIKKSRRVDAKTALMDLAGREERNLTATNGYSNVAANLGYFGNFPIVVGGGYYQVNATVPDPNQPAPGGLQPPTFLLTATPIGDQVKDTQCASYTLNNQGLQKAVDAGGADNTATCW